MARKPDWLKIAFDLHREAEAMRDAAPEGVEVTLRLCDYDHNEAAAYSVSLSHSAQQLLGLGVGSTPGKALKAAVEDLERARQKRAGTPTITAAPVPALPAKAE